MGSASRNRLEYEHRVNRVIDYIEAHRAEDLSLETLAQVAAFSPFHFHRIFKSITGENLKEFVQRVRLEWAGGALVLRPHADVLEIALDAGFQSASAFARAFKDHFGVTATEWRSGAAERWSKGCTADRKPGQSDRKPGKEADPATTHSSAQTGADAPPVKEETMNVTVTTLPTLHLAYMRHTGLYGAAGGIPQLWQRLERWAAARDLWTYARVCVGIAHDDPRVTPPEKCRYDAGIVIPTGFKPDAQVNVIDLPGGKYGVAPFTGTALEIAPCWERVFAEWLPQSGFQPDDRPCIEIYRGEAVDARTGKFTCELCMPVHPL